MLAIFKKTKNNASDRKKLKTLVGLHRVSHSLLSLHDLQDSLTVVAQNALEVLKADLIVLYEYLEEKQDVKIPPIYRGETLMPPDILLEKGRSIPHEDSVVFKLLKRQKPFYATDATRDWARAEFFVPSLNTRGERFVVQEKIVSSAGVPLLIDAQPLCVLFVNYRYPVKFTKDEREMIELFADYAALAIRNARILSQKERYVRELSILNEIGQALSSVTTLKIDSIIKTVREETGRLLDVKNFYIALYDEETEKYQFLFYEDQFDKVDSFASNQLRRSFTDYEENKERPLLVKEEIYRELLEKGEVELVGTHSRIWLGTPLMARGKVLGVMVVQNYEREDAFNEHDLEILTTIASQAAIAIYNAQRLNELANEVSFRKTLFDSSPIAFVVADTKGRVTHVNDAALKIGGYKKEVELIGKQVQNDIYWGGVEETKKISRQISENENHQLQRVEAFVKNKAGNRIPILLSAAFLTDEFNNRLGSVGVIEDQRIIALTGSARMLFDAIEDINASEKLENVLESILLSAIALLEGDKGCIFLRKGDYLVAREQYGYSKKVLEELKIKMGQDFIGRTADQATIQITTFDSSDTIESPLIDPAKSAICVPLKSEGHIIGVIYLESESLDRFELDKDLIQVLARQSVVAINRAQLLADRERTRDKLFATAKAVVGGQIATGFVHEIKNYLNNIGTTVANIKGKILSEKNIKSKRWYEEKIVTLEKEIIRQADLANRLQKFGQKLEPSKEESYLNDIVNSSLELLDSVITKKRLKLNLKLDSALESPKSEANNGQEENMILVDKGQIEQVIINLILNAIEASSPRSRLVVETILRNNAVFRIRDYGDGIEPKDRSELFQPFHTTKKDGVGLGLYMSKLIIENHQGSIEFSSKPAKGSTFSICIPLKKNQKEE